MSDQVGKLTLSHLVMPYCGCTSLDPNIYRVKGKECVCLEQGWKVCKQHLRSHRDLGIPADFLYHLLSALVCVFFETCVYVSVEYMRDAGEALVLLQKLAGIILCLLQALGASCP